MSRLHAGQVDAIGQPEAARRSLASCAAHRAVADEHEMRVGQLAAHGERRAQEHLRALLRRQPADEADHAARRRRCRSARAARPARAAAARTTSVSTPFGLQLSCLGCDAQAERMEVALPADHARDACRRRDAPRGRATSSWRPWSVASTGLPTSRPTMPASTCALGRWAGSRRCALAWTSAQAIWIDCHGGSSGSA